MRSFMSVLAECRGFGASLEKRSLQEHPNSNRRTVHAAYEEDHLSGKRIEWSERGSVRIRRFLTKAGTDETASP